jgi:DNA primase
MDNAVDQIKQKLDVVEVLGEYIKLTKAGRNWKGRCPFHAERTPSFMVSQERQLWHCFGCGAGGDIFKFVMQMEGLEFPDALRVLARRAGVVLKKQDPKVQSQKKRIYEIMELAAKFFEVQLQKTAEGKKALQYLKERGLKSETIKEWRLGWAHDKWRTLSDFLKTRGYKEEEIINAGLAIKSDGKNCYDRFRSRIIFPIFDIQGQVIAFGGRIFGEKAKEEGAKYVNSPQTQLYDKSRILFGLNKSKNEIRQKDLCVLVEGYMDLIMSWQAGVQNVVASSGTALTPEQLGIIGRYTKNLAMAFDSDIAGDSATRRSISLALAQDFEVKVIMMKDKDPAEVAKKNPADWQAAIEKAQSVMDFYFISTFAKNDAAKTEGKRQIKKILLPVIKAISSHTERSEWVRELAKRLRADEKDITYDLEKIKMDFSDNSFSGDSLNSSLPANACLSRLDELEEKFLGLCLSHPQHFHNIKDFSEEDFENKELAKIFNQFKTHIKKSKEGKATASLPKKFPSELKMKVDYMSLKIQQNYPVMEEEEIIKEIEACLFELKTGKIKQQLVSLSQEIKEAQGNGGKGKTAKLLEQFSRLSEKLTETIQKK